jgi:eukaryotic-like serine/threonine-protein kinase
MSAEHRVLILTDHTDLGRVVEHHISILWPDATCRVHAPLASGRLHSAFTAAGYDVVILDGRVERGRGLDWLDNLLCRPVFPPVVFLAESEAPEFVDQLLRRGAAGVLLRERVDHDRLAQVLTAALTRRREPLSGAAEVTSGIAVRVPGYRCVRTLARGSTATVYLAESERAGGMVVLKVLGTGSESGAPGQFSRFLQEYQLISRIRHANVVRIFDVGIAGEHAYFAMEHFARGDLRKHILRPPSPRVALAYLAQIAGGLHAVHQVGVLHRDLKPGNVMLRADGSLAIIDFGLAKQLELPGDITGPGEIFGTPYYMSPEQGHGRELDLRTDLYSLGVIFFEMLTGQKPYLASNAMNVIYMHANAPVPLLPAPLQRYQPLVARLLAKQPHERFASADELLAQIAGEGAS